MMASFALILAHWAKTINLRDNKIGDHGAEQLAAALPHMTSLQYLDLRSNNIRSAGKETLKRANKARPNPLSEGCIGLWL